MSSCDSLEGPVDVSTAIQNSCPRWCAIHHVGHGVEQGRNDWVHVSGAFVVKRTVLRLAVSIDPDTGVQDRCVVYVGEEEYTMYQAEVLIDALMQLVDQGSQFSGERLAQRPSGD